MQAARELNKAAQYIIISLSFLNLSIIGLAAI
jgi:hypothetical protein